MSKSAASCQFLSGNITSSTINVNIYHAKWKHRILLWKNGIMYKTC
jgi:hypothetical protein